MKYLFARPFTSCSRRTARIHAVPALMALLIVAAGCGGTAGEDGASPATDEVATPGSATGAGQQTPDAPRLGPDGTPIRVERLKIGGVPVSAEIADTPALRELGLMNRDSLAADYGMLFVYPDEMIRSFWMRNTRIPLDIAFIDRNGSIINIEQMEAQSDDHTYSTAPAMYALEMSQGWFEANGIGPGDRLEF